MRETEPELIVDRVYIRQVVGRVKGSSSNISVSRPPGVVSHLSTVAPPSSDSTVGLRAGWSLDQHLAHPAHL
ncbi:hypothetical protein E1301_Tti001152 [Triplophysa tibetana]|uniref:Uncharacterized protein n=1 Tax=Triplophysa tibetana TaxID=1572043 RepID=A0A5A9P6Z9_9TELE|nr:hypothetical protein E1301_Tti001152 [Triplophysa tibetana]